jgi:hypothetical protein
MLTPVDGKRGMVLLAISVSTVGTAGLTLKLRSGHVSELCDPGQRFGHITRH